MKKRIAAILVAASLAISVESGTVFAAGDTEVNAIASTEETQKSKLAVQEKETDIEISEGDIMELQESQTEEEINEADMAQTQGSDTKQGDSEADTVSPQEVREQKNEEKQRENLIVKTTDVEAEGSGFNAAMPLTVGGSVNGSITENISEKLYRFSIPSSGRITMTMTSYIEYYSAYIYDNTGECIWKSEYNNWNSNLKYIKDTYEIDLTKGNYYLKVTGKECDWYGTVYTGNYIISTAFASAGESYGEPNNDFSTSSALNLGQTVKGQIAINDKYDNYRFSLSSAGRINFTMNSYMPYYSLYIYDSTGECIWDSEFNEWNINLKYRKDIYEIDLAKGSYYLKVTGYKYSSYYASTGNYNFAARFTSAGVNYTEPNNEFSTAYALKTDTTLKGQIAENDRYDIMKFSLPKAKNVKLSITSYMKYYSIYIYDSTGEQLWSKEYNEWNANVGYRKDSYLLSIPAGSFYLKVTGYKYDTYYASTGTYSLNINTKVSVADTYVTPVGSRTYTGKAIRPSVIVKYNGVKLKNGRDYTVSYSNNKAIGTATVIIKGKGSYTGMKKASFKIVPKRESITSIKNLKGKAVMLKWKKDTSVSGYEIYRSTRKNSGYKKVKTITSKNTTSYKNNKLTKGKTYYYKVRAFKTVKGKKIYGNYSSAKSVMVKR